MMTTEKQLEEGICPNCESCPMLAYVSGHLDASVGKESRINSVIAAYNSLKGTGKCLVTKIFRAYYEGTGDAAIATNITGVDELELTEDCKYKDGDINDWI